MAKGFLGLCIAPEILIRFAPKCTREFIVSRSFLCENVRHEVVWEAVSEILPSAWQFNKKI